MTTERKDRLLKKNKIQYSCLSREKGRITCLKC
jgi:hypothetical protein